MKKALLIIVLTMLFNVSFPQGIDPLVNKTLRVKASELKVGNSLPTFMLVDRNGIIRYKADGYPKDLTGDIEKIMAQLRI